MPLKILSYILYVQHVVKALVWRDVGVLIAHS